MTNNRPFQTGDKILISTIYLDERGVQYDQPAKIIRRTASMGRLPESYHPVRFTSDKAVLLVHVSAFIHDMR